jgi:hypothetical protein
MDVSSAVAFVTTQVLPAVGAIGVAFLTVMILMRGFAAARKS